MTYIYVVRPNAGVFSADRAAATKEVIGRHFEYLKAAFDAGKVTFIGRCEDTTFGLAFFEAESLEAARAWGEADPAVAEGVFSLEVREFRTILSR